MLADGLRPEVVAHKLNCNVRSLNGLLDSPLCRDIDPRELRELGLRNAYVLYQRSRARLERLERAMPEGDDEAREHSAYWNAMAALDARARESLRVLQDAIEAIDKAGGGDAAIHGGLHLSFDGEFRPDLPRTTGEVMGRADDDDEDDDDSDG